MSRQTEREAARRAEQLAVDLRAAQAELADCHTELDRLGAPRLQPMQGTGVQFPYHLVGRLRRLEVEALGNLVQAAHLEATSALRDRILKLLAEIHTRRRRRRRA